MLGFDQAPGEYLNYVYGGPAFPSMKKAGVESFLTSHACAGSDVATAIKDRAANARNCLDEVKGMNCLIDLL